MNDEDYFDKYKQDIINGDIKDILLDQRARERYVQIMAQRERMNFEQDYLTRMKDTTRKLDMEIKRAAETVDLENRLRKTTAILNDDLNLNKSQSDNTDNEFVAQNQIESHFGCYKLFGPLVRFIGRLWYRQKVRSDE